MGRSKEFDPDAALSGAVELFWRKGYEATTMQDVVDHLGIGRASVYATFGGKRELYLRALDRYLEEVRDQTLRELSRGGAALPSVRGLVRRIATESAHDPESRGCLITNTAVECLPHEAQMEQRVRIGWEELETALRGTLLRAQDQGELDVDADSRALARFLVVVIQGVRVVSRLPEQAVLDDAVDQALSLIG